MKWGDATWARVHEARQRLADARRVSAHHAEAIAHAKAVIARAKESADRWRAVLKVNNKKSAETVKKIREETALIDRRQDVTYARVHEARQRLADARTSNEHHAEAIAHAKAAIGRERDDIELWKTVLKASNKKRAEAEKKIRAEEALISRLKDGQ